METKKHRDAPEETLGTKWGTSWISVVSGWLAALGASLILGGVLGATIFSGGAPEMAGMSEIVRLMVTLMAAFLAGGYVAGRMAGRLGLKHGLLVALLSVVAAAALVVVGLVADAGLTDSLNGVTLPGRPNTRQSLEPALSPPGILVILIPFVGGAFGGAWGAKTAGERP